MRHPIPDRVRRAVLTRARGHCEDCGRIAILELHHLTYDLSDVTLYHRDVGGLIFGYETPEVLLALCRECHLARHVVDGEFFGNPKEAEGSEPPKTDEPDVQPGSSPKSNYRYES
jgi:5-methylcytosine-specific restriction endonuclease McrA